jgi:hypothetical protein
MKKNIQECIDIIRGNIESGSFVLDLSYRELTGKDLEYLFNI